MKKKVILVEPDFPFPTKSKNKANDIHRNFVPVGLLKLGAYYKSEGYKVVLVRGKLSKKALKIRKPDTILVTSIFTYWSGYVWDAIEYYRALFPDTKIVLGGIYATLHRNKPYFKKKLNHYKVQGYYGLHSEAETYYPDYSLLESEISHHVTHTMRGCIRRCKFCGTWKIEPIRYDKSSEELQKEIKSIGKNRILFFDNNFLANQNVKLILQDLSSLRLHGIPVICESQSGFDGRLLQKDPELAVLLKQARFKNIRIAWDNSYKDYSSIKKQIALLTEVGYKAKDMSVFMVYNFDVTYEEMLKKLNYCKQMGVQITDCRFRPLNSTFDKYNPQKFRKGQTEKDYYIHTKSGWNDQKIRDFRKRVRQHNIWIRYGKDCSRSYDKRLEKWSDIHNTFKFFKMGKPPKIDKIENSQTWSRRISKLNKVKSYYKKNNLNSLSFENVKYKEIDRKLVEIIDDVIDENKLRNLNR